MLNDFTISSGRSLRTQAQEYDGNFTNNGAYTAGTSAVTFKGTSAQQIGGSNSTTFGQFTMNNSAGVSLNGVDMTVSGVLTLTSGNITTGASHKVIVTGTTAAAVVHTSGYIDGTLQRGVCNTTLYLGRRQRRELHAGFTQILSGTNAGATLTVTSTAGENPNAGSGVDQAHDVNTYWTLASTNNMTFGTSTFTYPSGNIDPGSTASAFIAKRWNGSTWTPVTVSGTPTTTSTSVTGLTTATSVST